MKTPTASIRSTLNDNPADQHQGDTTPIHLPAAMAGKLRALAEASGIDGGADAFIAAVLGDMLETTAADILIDGWKITDPATIAELYRIQSRPD